MRNTLLLLFPLLLAAGAAQADVFLITVDTSSINGDTGSLDFSLSSGAGSDQSLTATVSDFIGGSYGGTQATDGSVSGGPVTAGTAITIGPIPDASGLNDDFETFTYGNTLSFFVSLNGPALTAPDGNATSPYEFDFETFSDLNGVDPVLTPDPNGIAGSVDVSPDGVVSNSAVSGQLTIAPGQVTITPEPGSFWLFAGVLAFAGAAFVRRGIGSSSSR